MFDNENKYEAIDTYLTQGYEQFCLYDRFKFLISRIGNRLEPDHTLLDLGCAKGELIYCAKRRFPKTVTYVGVEQSSELIEKTRNVADLNDVRFVCANVENVNLEEKFDHVVMSGVLSCFDDLASPISSMVNHLKDTGWGYIFGPFNEDDVDLLVRFRNNYRKSKKWESGMNIFSLGTIKRHLKELNRKFLVHRFEISTDLPKHEDPVKSFTIRTETGERIIVTGCGVLLQYFLIEFQKQ